jgi:Fe-S-cluster containining protein
MKCSECIPSECCRFDQLGSEVISNVAAAVRMTPEDFLKIFHERKTNNGFCPYLDKNRDKCTIYDERPEVCRDYFCDEWEPE